MRRVWITRAGAPEVLQVREEPDPTAAEGQVRIKVSAAGINFADLMARMGLYPDAPKIPCVVGYEVSGVVDEVGAGVSGLSVGDRVFGMPRFGGYTDTLAIPADQVFRMPEKMTFEQAAALPVVYLTAYNMMLFTGTVRPGSSILIHSAAGGVGHAAIQIAKTRGCTIFGTASPGKHDHLRRLGVQHPIDSGGDYVAAVRGLVGDKGVDLILDPVGGASWSSGFELLAPCGRLVAFGMSAVSSGKKRSLLHAIGQVLQVKKISPMKLMDENKTFSGTNMGHLFSRLDLLRPQFQALLEMFVAGEIAPHFDRTFKFEEAPAAHHFIHDRKAIGKVLLVP
ncbi:MAG TPA: medium chain dehydrogenase/reductase family protein [Polyangiaceae bacterium]